MEAYGAEAWRCFFAQYAHAHVATPALFHEYLYDSANLGFDGALAANFSDFRARMEASFSGSAAASSPPYPRLPGSAAGASALANRVLGADGEGGRPAAPPAEIPAAHSNGYPEPYTGAAGMERALLASAAGSGMAAAGVPAPGVTLLPREQSMDPSTAPGPAAARTEAAAGARVATVFAPACQLHEVIDGPLFTSSHIGGVLFIDLLGGWWAGDATPTVIDAHLGPRSAAECSADPASAAGTPLPPSPIPVPDPSSNSIPGLPPPGSGHDVAEARGVRVAGAPQAGGPQGGGAPVVGAVRGALAPAMAGKAEPKDAAGDIAWLPVPITIEGIVF